MTGAWKIARAGPGDGRDIARLVRSSLPCRVRALTIWASPRVSRYLEDILRGGLAWEGHAFYILRRGPAAEGVAAFRQSDGTAFLNHLHVAPRFRSRSLGARLLAEAARYYLEAHPSVNLGLDVFAGNPLAEAWYARLGFTEHSRNGWWVWQRRSDRAAGREGDGGIPMTVADRQHRAWGFSHFVAQVNGGTRYEVGRLYTPYFRLMQPEAAADLKLQQALRVLDPSRRPLRIGPERLPHPPWEKVAVSRRLEAPAAVLWAHLEASAGRGA